MTKQEVLIQCALGLMRGEQFVVSIFETCEGYTRIEPRECIKRYLVIVYDFIDTEDFSYRYSVDRFANQMVYLYNRNYTGSYMYSVCTKEEASEEGPILCKAEILRDMNKYGYIYLE